nr:T9SS type A sorting domain-containing protein [uncultured Draconibacterium sp.]
MKNLFIFVLVVLPFVSFSQTIEIKDFKVLEPAGINYSGLNKFDFEFAMRGNYNASKISIKVYKNSIDLDNIICSCDNSENDFDDQTYYPNYITKQTWSYTSKSYSTNQGSTFYLQVTFRGTTQTLSYTCPEIEINPEIEIKDFKVLEPAGINYSGLNRFDFKFAMRGNYNASKISIKVYKNSIDLDNIICSCDNSENDFDDQTYYPNYITKQTWSYTSKSYSTNQGSTFYLQVTFLGVTQTLSYTYPGIEIKDFKVLEPAGINYSGLNKFDFEFAMRGNYNASKISIVVYKNSINLDNIICGCDNSENDFDDKTYYPNYITKQTWSYTSKSYSTNQGSTFYLQVTFLGVTQTLSYTCETTGDPDFSLTNVELPVVDGSTQLPTFDYNNTDVNNIKVTVKNNGGVGKLDKIGWVFTKTQQNSIDNYIYNAVATGGLNSGFANIATGSSHTYDVNINIPYDYYSSGHNIRFMGEFYLCVIVESGAYREAHAEKIYIKDSFKSGLIPISLLKSGSIDPSSKESQSLLVYPNPSEGVFNLELGNNGNYTARVFNLAGQEIWEQKVTGDNKVQIDLKNSASATYILEIIDQNESVLKKKLIIK